MSQAPTDNAGRFNILYPLHGLTPQGKQEAERARLQRQNEIDRLKAIEKYAREHPEDYAAAVATGRIGIQQPERLGQNVPREVTLFDAYGNATAYVATDAELTIFMWSGVPVAYLKPDGKCLSIFGFNGRHLGWLDSGIVRNHGGLAVGFVGGFFAGVVTNPEPIKGIRQLRPLAAVEEIPPLRPLDQLYFSNTPLSQFLEQGVR